MSGSCVAAAVPAEDAAAAPAACAAAAGRSAASSAKRPAAVMSVAEGLFLLLFPMLRPMAEGTGGGGDDFYGSQHSPLM